MPYAFPNLRSQISFWALVVDYKILIPPLTQPVHRVGIVGVSKIFGPDELQSAELPLDHIGSQFVLIDFLAVGGESHRSEEGHQAGILQGFLDVFRGKGCGPLKYVLNHIGGGIGLCPVIVRLLVVSCSEPAGVSHGAGKG